MEGRLRLCEEAQCCDSRARTHLADGAPRHEELPRQPQPRPRLHGAILGEVVAVEAGDHVARAHARLGRRHERRYVDHEQPVAPVLVDAQRLAQRLVLERLEGDAERRELAEGAVRLKRAQEEAHHRHRDHVPACTRACLARRHLQAAWTAQRKSVRLVEPGSNHNQSESISSNQ